MIETPVIIQIERRLTAVIPISIPRSEIRSVMGPALQELMEVVAEQKIPRDGAWFAHHFQIDPEIFDFEVGVPVARAIQPQGRVRPSEWPAMTVARTILHGPYGGLPKAWAEFNAWIESNNYKPGPEVWECYLSGPEVDRDPASFRTELSRPVKTW